MRNANRWTDYRLVDTGDGEKLEYWGKVLLRRPDPQAIWRKLPQNEPLWAKADARYHRSAKGGGSWEVTHRLPESWQISYPLLLDADTTYPLTFKITPTGFKHTGLFPEQATNWDLMATTVHQAVKAGRKIKALNLFAYTGGATLALAAAGAEVTHVDASKGMVNWARENAAFSGLSDKPIRWIVDDCEKYVRRELRRGNRYDVLVLDPPSYGRGPGGEIWKLEEQVDSLISLCTELLTDSPLLVVFNSYTAGLNPGTTAYLLGLRMSSFAGSVSAEEIGLPAENGLSFPCGSTALFVGK